MEKIGQLTEIDAHERHLREWVNVLRAQVGELLADGSLRLIEQHLRTHTNVIPAQ